jgi:hypothetical protein
MDREMIDADDLQREPALQFRQREQGPPFGGIRTLSLTFEKVVPVADEQLPSLCQSISQYGRRSVVAQPVALKRKANQGIIHTKHRPQKSQSGAVLYSWGTRRLR